MNKYICKFFRLFALCALILGMLSLLGCAFADSDEGYFDRWDLNYFLYESDCIVEEAWCHEMMDDEFDRALMQYYSDELVEAVPTLNLGENEQEPELVTSILSFSNACYGYWDDNGNIVSIPLSDELVDWWNNYGSKSDEIHHDAYRRPVPSVEFDGTQFNLVTREIPGNSNYSELGDIAIGDIREIDEDIVHEFLMRTYGLQRDMVDQIILEHTYEMRHSDAYGGEVPVTLINLWFTTTDGIVSKLDASHQNPYIYGDEFYIVLNDKGNSVYAADFYPWPEAAA